MGISKDAMDLKAAIELIKAVDQEFSKKKTKPNIPSQATSSLLKLLDTFTLLSNTFDEPLVTSTHRQYDKISTIFLAFNHLNRIFNDRIAETYRSVDNNTVGEHLTKLKAVIILQFDILSFLKVILNIEDRIYSIISSSDSGNSGRCYLSQSHTFLKNFKHLKSKVYPSFLNRIQQSIKQRIRLIVNILLPEETGKRNVKQRSTNNKTPKQQQQQQQLHEDDDNHVLSNSRRSLNWLSLCNHCMNSQLQIRSHKAATVYPELAVTSSTSDSIQSSLHKSNNTETVITIITTTSTKNKTGIMDDCAKKNLPTNKPTMVAANAVEVKSASITTATDAILSLETMERLTSIQYDIIFPIYQLYISSYEESLLFHSTLSKQQTINIPINSKNVPDNNNSSSSNSNGHENSIMPNLLTILFLPCVMSVITAYIELHRQQSSTSKPVDSTDKVKHKKSASNQHTPHSKTAVTSSSSSSSCAECLIEVDIIMNYSHELLYTYTPNAMKTHEKHHITHHHFINSSSSGGSSSNIIHHTDVGYDDDDDDDDDFDDNNNEHKKIDIFSQTFNNQIHVRNIDILVMKTELDRTKQSLIQLLTRRNPIRPQINLTSLNVLRKFVIYLWHQFHYHLLNQFDTITNIPSSSSSSSSSSSTAAAADSSSSSSFCPATNNIPNPSHPPKKPLPTVSTALVSTELRNQPIIVLRLADIRCFDVWFMTVVMDNSYGSNSSSDSHHNNVSYNHNEMIS